MVRWRTIQNRLPFLKLESSRRLLRAAVLGPVLTLGACEGYRDTLEGPKSVAPSGPGEESVQPLAGQADSIGRIQQTVMDFSDQFVTATWAALDRYISEEPDVTKQVRAQRLKVALATASMTIAASKDPRANLLDMAVFISAGRWAVDRYWIPVAFGEKAAPLAAVYAEMNREIEAEVARVLTPAQRSDLRDLIATWKAAQPSAREVMNVRLRNLDGVVLKRFEESPSAKGLLVSVRKWLGDVNQSLLYGERMMFYIERTPLILSQQADLTVDRVAERFPIATINPNFDQWIDLANTVPPQIKALLEGRQEFVREALPEVRDSLDSLARISESLHGTLVSADSLATKVQQLPFKPDEYASALNGASSSLDKVNEIVAGLNRLMDDEHRDSNAEKIAQILDDRANHLMNELFLRVAALIGLFIGGLLLVLVVARLLFRRSLAVRVDRKD